MIALLLVACVPEEQQTANDLETWGEAWCSYRKECCMVENTDAPSSCDEEYPDDVCVSDWVGSSEGCVVIDPDRFAECIACYESAPLDNVVELGHSCISNVAAICADACDSTLDCPETL